MNTPSHYGSMTPNYNGAATPNYFEGNQSFMSSSHKFKISRNMPQKLLPLPIHQNRMQYLKTKQQTDQRLSLTSNNFFNKVSPVHINRPASHQVVASEPMYETGYKNFETCN